MNWDNPLNRADFEKAYKGAAECIDLRKYHGQECSLWKVFNMEIFGENYPTCTGELYKKYITYCSIKCSPLYKALS